MGKSRFIWVWGGGGRGRGEGANHIAGGEGLKGLRALCGITFVDITKTK